MSACLLAPAHLCCFVRRCCCCCCCYRALLLQMDLVSVVDGVVQRQDQLAEMVAELAGALQGLRAVKAQPGSLMPWL